jgi:predicted Zn-dependent protease
MPERKSAGPDPSPAPDDEPQGSASSEASEHTTDSYTEGDRYEYYASLAEDFGRSAERAVESFQEDAGSREATLSSGATQKIAPRKVDDVIVYSDSRSGAIVETEEKGNIKAIVTPVEKDRRGKVKRGRFYLGAQVEAVTMAPTAKAVNLRPRAKDPTDFEITTQVDAVIRDVIPEAQRRAESVDKKITEENYEYFPPRHEPPVVASVPTRGEIDIDVDLMARLVAAAKERVYDRGGGRIDTVHVQMARFDEHKVIATASGTRVSEVTPRTSFVIMLRTTKGSEAFVARRGSMGTMEECLRRYRKEDDQTDLIAIVRELADEAVAVATDLDRAQGAAIVGTEFPVILSPEVAGVLAHEVFGHPAEGDIIVENRRDKSSKIQLKSRLGAQLSDNPKFFVLDTPFPDLVINGQRVHRFNWGAFVHDGYGTLAKDCRIVEAGIMVEAMTDMHCHEEVVSGLSVARRMNERGFSGSVRRENYSVAPLIRMRNTFILPDPQGPTTPEEMAAKYPVFKTKKGLYIAKCAGGWVNTQDGTWVIKGTLCYLIENGHVTNKPVANATITGNLSKTMSLIGGIGNAKSMTESFTGFCGKDDEWVPVDGGGPLIFIEHAQLAGGTFRTWFKIVEEFAQQIEEVKVGKRSRDQLYVREIAEASGTPGRPHPNVCLSTTFLPFPFFTSIITGKGRQHPTHDLVWDEEAKEYRVVERGDPYGRLG